MWEILPGSPVRKVHTFLPLTKSPLQVLNILLGSYCHSLNKIGFNSIELHLQKLWVYSFAECLLETVWTLRCVYTRDSSLNILDLAKSCTKWRVPQVPCLEYKSPARTEFSVLRGPEIPCWGDYFGLSRPEIPG